jgi:hypothetical protein
VLPGGGGPALWCEGGFATGGRPVLIGAPFKPTTPAWTPWSIG